MEGTAYNRKIADEVKAINRRYINNQVKKGYMLEDMPITKQTIAQGKPFEGSGIISGLLGAIGLGKKGGIQTGGDMMDNINSWVKNNLSWANDLPAGLGRPKKGGVSTGGKRGRPRKMAGTYQANGFLDDLADGAMKVGSTALSLAPLLALGKPKKGGRLKKGGEIALNMRDENFSTPAAAGRRRRGGVSTGGIATGGLSRKLLGARAVGSGLGELEGAGIFDDILSGMNKTMGLVSQGKALHNMIKGKGKKAGIATGGKRRRAGVQTGGEMKAAGFLDDVFNTVGNTLSTAANAAQLAKQFGFLKGKGKKAGIATGGKRGASKWIMHVKKYAKDHNMKYNEALKDPKCKSTYKNM